MSVLAAILLTVFGIMTAICGLIVLIACIVIAERVRVLPEVVTRLDNIESYLDELNQDISTEFSPSTYYFPPAEAHDRPVPPEIQTIIDQVDAVGRDNVDPKDLEALENFFNGANDMFMNNDNDDDDDEDEKKPWKKK